MGCAGAAVACRGVGAASVGLAKADRRDTVAGTGRCSAEGSAVGSMAVADGLRPLRRWQRDGTWPGLVTRQAWADPDRLITWEVNVDSTSCRAHQHAVDARRYSQAQKEPSGGSGAEPEDHGLGRCWGRLRHQDLWFTSVAVLDEGGYEIVRRDTTRNEHEVTTAISINVIARGLTVWVAARDFPGRPPRQFSTV